MPTKYNIEDAALAEKLAEQSRAEAEAAWRQAWWTTTLALAEPQEKEDVTAAYNTAGRILGQGRSWLAARRAAGRAVKDLVVDDKIIFSLAPTITVEYVRTGKDRSALAEVVADAEARGLSLRDFATEIGSTSGQGPSESWRGEPVATAGMVSRALARPEVADAVVKDEGARAAIADARLRQEARRSEARSKWLDANPDARDVNERIGRVGSKIELDDALLKLRTACRDFARTVAAELPGAGRYTGGTGPLSLFDGHQRAAEAYEFAGKALAAVEQYINGGGTDLDAELSKILREV